MRDSPSLVIIPELIAGGAKIRAHDPVGIEEARKHMPDIDYRQDAYDTMNGADAVVILTEWNSYRALDLARVKTLLKAPVLVDLRNIYRPDEMAAFGFNYSSLGRPRAL
jgi:UDPglucose 6-dehydrogenase